MISRKLAFSAGVFIVFVVSLLSCKKINESSLLGGNLIPAVDNITTFDTILDVEAYNDIFSLTNPAGEPDSIALGSGETHFLGNITTDPLFGRSAGTVFMQLKPTTFKLPFAFKHIDSLIALDSVVLVLKYVTAYGDTMQQQAVNVFEIDHSNVFRNDSSYRVRENNFTYTNFLGTRTYFPADLNDSIKLFRDTVLTTANELRIKLDDAFGQRLLNYDSSDNVLNNAYYSDSAFNLLFKGFAVVPGGTGNALIGLNPSTSKLAIYYRYKKNGLADTTVTNFSFLSTSAKANYVQRDYSGSQLANYQDPNTPHDFVFLQTQPGTFATIKVPGLIGLSNRVVHRAELILEQAAYDPVTDSIFRVPQQLFLDYYDSSANHFAASTYDFNGAYNSSTFSYTYNAEAYGMQGKKEFDLAGNQITKWNFDISRWVQNIVSGRDKYYPMRLSAPFRTRLIFTSSTAGRVYSYLFPLNPSIAAGRVRLYGGTPASNPERMRVRIIYSKI